MAEHLTRAQHDEIAARIAAGEGRNHISREMRVTTWSVSRSARMQNLIFDNAVSGATLSAAMAAAKAARLQMQLDALEEAQAVLAQFHQDYTAFSFGGKDNVYTAELLDGPPVDAQLKIAQTHRLLLQSAIDLAKTDSETGVDAVKSMLGGLAEVLGIGVPKPQDPDGPPTP